MKTSLLFFCLWVISTCVWAGPEHQTSEIILLKDFHFLVDSTQELTANEIGHLLSSDAFEHAETQFVHFTIEQPVVWLSFNHHTIKGNPCYVSPGNESNIWNASLFVKDSVGGYVELFEYDHLEKDLDPRSLYFSTLAINLPPNGEDFLLRLRAPQNRSYNLILGSRYAISKHLILRERVSIAFIGFMLCIFIYNSFLFISTRLKVLIPYLAYLLMVTFAVPFHSGFVLYSTPGMWQGEPWYTVWLAPTHAAIGFFCIQYLNLKEIAPKFRKLILVLMALLTIATPILDFNHWVSVSWMSRIVPVLVVLYNTCLWTSGVYVWINGAKHARFYVMGWIFVIASLTVFSLSMFGMIPYNPNIDFVLYFGFASESVLFAFALGDQMNMLRKEKQSMEKTHLETTTEKNRLLAQQLFMNSHLLRAPLSRVLGLLGLLKTERTKAENEELLGHVEDATLEMDSMTRKMSAILEKEGYLDQYQDDFEEVNQTIHRGLENKKERL